MTHLRRLERDSDFVVVSSKGWAGTLLLVLELGWNANGSALEYLAPNVIINRELADALALIINEVLTLAVEDPITVFPTNLDMGELYVIGDFASRGAFEVHDELFSLQ